MWVLQKLRSILFPFAACGRESIIEETAPVQKYEPALTCTSPAESSAETLSWFEDDLMFDFEPEAKEQEEEIDEDVAERINRLLHTDDTYLQEVSTPLWPICEVFVSCVQWWSLWLEVHWMRLLNLWFRRITLS